MALKPFITET